MIAVIEDDVKVQLVIGAILRRAKIEYTCYGSVDEYKSLKNETKIDLVLLDNYLPGEDGVDALESSKELFISTPVILMTAGSEAEVIDLAFKRGAIDFLRKPFAPETLLARIKKNLNQDILIKQKSEELENGRDMQIQSYPLFYNLSTRYSHQFVNSSEGGLSGDVYENIKLPNGEHLILFGDVCGHGLKSAIVSLLLSQYFRLLIESKDCDLDICSIGRKLDTFIKNKFSEEEYVTAVILREKCSGEIEVVSYAHPYISQLDLYGDMSFIRFNESLPLGLLDNKDVTKRNLKLNEYTSLLLLTDGVGENIYKEQAKTKNYINLDLKSNSVFEIATNLSKEYSVKDDSTFLLITPRNIYWDSREHYVSAITSTKDLHKVLVEFNSYKKISKKNLNKIKLVLSEYISNCLLHGQTSTSTIEPLVVVTLKNSKESIDVSVYHNTGQFDLIKHSVSKEIDREKGGMGISILKNICNDVAQEFRFDMTKTRFSLGGE